jgi:hypothetical protein
LNDLNQVSTLEESAMFSPKQQKAAAGPINDICSTVQVIFTNSGIPPEAQINHLIVVSFLETW